MFPIPFPILEPSSQRRPYRQSRYLVTSILETCNHTALAAKGSAGVVPSFGFLIVSCQVNDLNPTYNPM